MKTKGLILLASAFLMTAMVLVGCKKKEPAPPSPAQTEGVKETAAKEAEKTVAEINPICPVMEGPVNPDIFAEYQGKKVYFCCPACKGQFEADPQKYLAKLPQFNK